MDSDAFPLVAGNAQFPSTRWSLVQAAKASESPAAREAIAYLCQTYWYPLFAYIRRRGNDAVQAQDLVQGFFLSLLERNSLKNVEPGHGRFRHWILAACKNYLAEQHRHASAQKRGGSLAHLSLDFKAAEERYRLEPAHEASADQLFEYRWTLALVERVLLLLGDECRAEGKSDLFDQLSGYLDGQKDVPYREAAQCLGTSEGAVKTAVHRLRQRFAGLFREEIGQTLGPQDDIDDEIRAVFRALTSCR